MRLRESWMSNSDLERWIFFLQGHFLKQKSCDWPFTEGSTYAVSARLSAVNCMTMRIV